MFFNTIQRYRFFIERWGQKGIYVGLNADKLAYPIFAGFNNMQGVCQRVVFINNMDLEARESNEQNENIFKGSLVLLPPVPAD